MTGRLKLLCIKVKARVSGGEDINTVLCDYPLLTESEKDIIIKETDNTQQS